MDAMPEPIPFKTEGPQPLLREIPPGAPYPVHALGPLQAAVEAVTDKSQAPAALAAQSALAVASLAVQPHADVETLAGDAPLSLFCLTIAESGERKSYCDRLLMQGLRGVERDRAREYADEKSEHDVRHKVWSEKRKRLIAEAAGAKKDKVAAAEADLRAMGPEPRAPLLPNLTTAEPTFPGLVKLYQAGSPSLGLFSDDAGGFIGGHAMNTDNRLATAPPKPTDRRAFEGETVQAEAIPPDVLSRLVRDAIEARQDARIMRDLLAHEAEARAELLERFGGEP